METNIEYADQVSNPLYVVDKETGEKGTHCEKPDPEGTCKECWAETLNRRGGPGNKRFGTGLTFGKENRDRIEWHRHEKEMARLVRLNARKPMSEKFPGNPLAVFTNDTYDLFQPSITDELRDWVFDIYDKLTDLTLLIQSTYVAAMMRYLRNRYPGEIPNQYVIGMSAGTQEFYDNNIVHIARIGARRRYVIFEPLLEKVTLRLDTLAVNLAWVIVGGESGSNPRECDIHWIRSLAQECQAAGVAVLVKQLGSFPTAMTRISAGFAEDRRWKITDVGALRLVTISRKGGKLEDLPPDLRIRQFPMLEAAL